MAVYSAVKGSNAVIYFRGEVLCTAKSCEIISERALHEVYECFATEPTAIIKGKERYRVILESIVFENFDINLLNSDNISIEVFVGNKLTALDGCYFNIHNKKINKNSIVERLEILARKRTECVMA